MKKLRSKNLSLHRETLRSLASQDLPDIVGGSCMTCLTGTCGCEELGVF